MRHRIKLQPRGASLPAQRACAARPQQRECRSGSYGASSHQECGLCSKGSSLTGPKSAQECARVCKSVQGNLAALRGAGRQDGVGALHVHAALLHKPRQRVCVHRPGNRRHEARRQHLQTLRVAAVLALVKHRLSRRTVCDAECAKLHIEEQQVCAQAGEHSPARCGRRNQTVCFGPLYGLTVSLVHGLV